MQSCAVGNWVGSQGRASLGGNGAQNTHFYVIASRWERGIAQRAPQASEVLISSLIITLSVNGTVNGLAQRPGNRNIQHVWSISWHPHYKND